MSSDEQNEQGKYTWMLMDWERTASTSFDKAMLTLSAGALTLSLTYLKGLSTGPPWHWMLKTCWIMFAASLLSTSWSFLFSQHAMRRQREIPPLGNPKPHNTKSESNRWAAVTNHLNWVSAGCFTLGVVLLTLYAISGAPGGSQS